MGLSSIAYIYYGFPFHDEDSDLICDWMEEHECDWENKAMEVLNVVDDSGMWTPEGEYAVKEGTKEFTVANKKLEAFYNRKRAALEKLTHDGLIEIDTSGHYDSPTYFLSLDKRKAYCYESTPIADLGVEPSSVDKLRVFCKKMDIPWQEPAWYLSAYYG
jgi:hypothetical protein